MATRGEILGMDRDELVKYLESWGYQCYDHESTWTLRTAALDNHKTEKA